MRYSKQHGPFAPSLLKFNVCLMKTDPKDAASILQMYPLFEHSPLSQLQQLATKIEAKQFGREREIYSLGDRSDRLYFLIKGVVKIGRHSSDKREVIKHILHPMSMFGELSLTGEQHRKDFALTMKPNTQILVLPTTHLQRLMREDHELSMRTLHFLGNRLQYTESRLESLIFKDARERIIEFLKDAAERRGKQVGYETLIKHSLTQQDIANITGTSRQTVTSVMNDLRKSNLIYFNRRSILIRDMAKLS